MPRGFQHFGLILAGCSGFSVTAEGSLRIVRWQSNNWMTKTWIMEVKAAFTTWTLTFAVSGQFGSSWGHQNFWQLICIWKWVAKNWPNDVVVALLFRLAASQLRSCQSLNGNPGGIVAMVFFLDGRGSFRGPWDPLKVDEKPQRIPQNPVRSFWMDRNPEDSRNSPTEPFEMDKNPGRIPQNPLKILENLQESRNKSLKILQKCFQICKNPSTSHQIPWKSFQICKNPSKSFKKNPFKSRRIPQNPSKSFQINKNPKVSLKILF